MENFKYSQLVDKLINYDGPNVRIKEVSNHFCDVLTGFGNSDIFPTSNESFIGESIGIVVEGKHFFGRAILDSTIREGETHMYEIHSLPFKDFMGESAIMVNVDEELQLVTDNFDKIKESIQYDQIDLMTCGNKDVCVIDYNKAKEYATHNSLMLQESTEAYMPTYLGGSIRENINVMFRDGDKVVVDTIDNAHNYDELVVTSGEEINVTAFKIKELAHITQSGYRIAPTKSVYNDNDLVSMVNEYELERINSIRINEAGKGRRKVATGSKKILKTMTSLRGFESKLRGGFKKLRNSREERYKQQILNEEILPVADSVFRTFISAVVVGGAVVLGGPVGLLFGGIVSMILNTVLKLNFKNKKEICLKLLNDQIAQVEEEIADARAENDLSTKNALLQVQRQLIRKRDKLKYKGSLSTRG